MNKKIIGIFVSIMLIITGVATLAHQEQPEIIIINFSTDDVLEDTIIEHMLLNDPCIEPDNGGGTVDLPADCPYTALNDPLYIIDGLSPGTTIELDPVLTTFTDVIRLPGGSLGGEIQLFNAFLQLDIQGTGDLAGFTRSISLPVSLETHTGPRNPGDPVQTFSSDLIELTGELFGDPDFCTLSITWGTNYGLPSPGQYILTELPSGDFNIDSFFDVSYQIEFEGCPGSILEGMIGTTTGTTRIQQGVTFTNSPPNTPDQLSGPSTGLLFQTLRYHTSISDPDGDPMRIGIDYFNDGMVDEWSSIYYPSGVNLYIDITFTYVGTYQITLKARDIHGAESGWAPPKTVVITEGENNPPSIPSTPLGPISGMIDTLYSYSTSSIDADGDQIRYGFDWSGNGVIDEWSSFLDSGDICTLSHTWSETGIYPVKVKAKDENDFESDWSLGLNVTIIDANSPPNKPETPTGFAFGRIGKSYTFSSSTIDIDGDQIYYKWYWGDEESDWDGPYISGVAVSTSHIWENQGSFVVKVKAKDSKDAESVWSDPFSVTMPKFKGFSSMIYVFLENHPHIFPLLHRLFT